MPCAPTFTLKIHYKRALQASSGRGATSKSVSKAIERPGLTEEEIEEIREAFNLFDTDGSGVWPKGLQPIATYLDRTFRRIHRPEGAESRDAKFRIRSQECHDIVRAPLVRGPVTN
jgi:hypothetical protein